MHLGQMVAGAGASGGLLHSHVWSPRREDSQLGLEQPGSSGIPFNVVAFPRGGLRQLEGHRASVPREASISQVAFSNQPRHDRLRPKSTGFFLDMASAVCLSVIFQGWCRRD